MKLSEPISSAASHRTVIARIGGGSQSALASFFDTTSHLVFALVVRMIGDNAAAEAILAEVYMQVWNQAARYNSGSEQPLTWLFRLARQEALVHLQTNGRVPAQMGMAVAVSAMNGAGEAAQPQRVRLALGLLPAEQLQVIEMAYFGGLNYHEIAAALQCSPDLIRQRIGAAMKCLRANLIAHSPARVSTEQT